MFESIISSGLDLKGFVICIGVALVLGLIVSIIHMKTSKYTKNFVITLSILPALVATVILMVNGNLGTSVAVLGAFGLIRFRSVPGNSREKRSFHKKVDTFPVEQSPPMDPPHDRSGKGGSLPNN